MKTILIIEDEKAMRKIIRDYLNKHDYFVFEAENGQEGLDIFYKEKIDMIILDIMIPEYDGWSVCRKLRETSNIPIIMLTARSDEADIVFGLELGADEYITKPFSPKILIAKVNALFRRVEQIDEYKEILEYQKLRINTKSHQVFFEDKLLDLTPKEYDLLLFMAKNVGIAISRNELVNKVWGYNYFGDMRTVDTHIKRLRKKLNGKFIITVRGIGYRFEVADE